MKEKSLLVGFGLFILCLALALSIPNVDSLLINFKELNPRLLAVFQVGFLILAIGFLVGGVFND